MEPELTSPSRASLATIARQAALFRQASPNADAVDFTDWLAAASGLRDWDRRDVYQACLARLPEREAYVGSWSYASDIDRARHIVACLLCDEFRLRFVSIFGSALPDVRKVFHIHVPRTGGTSFTRALETGEGSLAWHTSFASAEWLEVEAGKRRLDSLGYIVRLLAQFGGGGGRLFIMGHEPLPALLDAGYVRADDIVCTIIRDPVAICLSILDYTIDTARRDTGRPDAEDWRTWIEAEGCAHILSGDDDPAAMRTLLRSDRFRRDYADLLCHMFSLDGTVEGALYALDLTRCAVLLPAQTEGWARSRLGLDITMERRNASSGNAAALLESNELRYIREDLCARDCELFAALQRRENALAGRH